MKVRKYENESQINLPDRYLAKKRYLSYSPESFQDEPENFLQTPE
jgi:hypothetical protein